MPPKHKNYWRRYDLMYKKHSKKSLINTIYVELRRNRLIKHYKRGRKPIVKKEMTIAFILIEKIHMAVYREMEMDGDGYLPHKYDHSLYQYHYTSLSEDTLLKIVLIFEKKCKKLLNEIYLHVLDSTGLSTSVRVPRIRQGTRVKEKLTTKYHTMLGYDPPNKIIIVENSIASDNHLSDGKGGENMIKETPKKGYLFGDSAYETYALTELAQRLGMEIIVKPTKKEVHKKLSVKAKLRKVWKGNHSRLYKEIRGIGEVLYGAATRAGLIHTHSKLTDNQHKDSLIISIRQNVFSYLRLEALIGLIRQTRINLQIKQILACFNPP